MLFTMAVSASAQNFDIPDDPKLEESTTYAPEIANHCYFCYSEFYNESSYNLHMIICENLNSSDPLVYLCGYCGDQVETKLDLASHYKGCAGNSSYGSYYGNMCMYCGNRFSVESDFNNHIQLCCPVEECEECGREVVSKYYEEHLDECGSGKTLSFMDRIVAFFERIINFFKNLF